MLFEIHTQFRMDDEDFEELFKYVDDFSSFSIGFDYYVEETLDEEERVLAKLCYNRIEDEFFDRYFF